MQVGKHPNADALYLEEIDVGEDKPRQVSAASPGFLRTRTSLKLKENEGKEGKGRNVEMEWLIQAVTKLLGRPSCCRKG